MLRMLVLTLALFAATGASAQGWRGAASPYDLERLDSADNVLAQVIPVARAGGEARDVRALDGLAGPSQPIEGEALLGNWKCRTMKLGGKYLDLIVYGWFRCRVSIGAAGLFFEKLTGSQRTSGYLWPEYPASGAGCRCATSILARPTTAATPCATMAGRQTRCAAWRRTVTTRASSRPSGATTCGSASRCRCSSRSTISSS